MKFIAIFDGYWGKAETVEKACDRAENYGATVRPLSKVIIFEVIDDGAFVNNEGILVYEPIIGHGEEEAVEVFRGIMQHLVTTELYDRKAGAFDETTALVVRGEVPKDVITKAAALAREEEEIRCS